MYHVLLEGKKMGPYDRRTIVGMRIKKTLTSDHVLIGMDGTQLTVRDLIEPPGAGRSFQPDRSGSLSVVQATFSANLVGVRGKGVDIPAFRGEVEARVQGEVLRIAGRFRKRLRWKEDRIKIVLTDVIHARVSGSQVDLWLRTGQAPGSSLDRISLNLLSNEAAQELVQWLPSATPWPEQARAKGAESNKSLWVAGAGLAAVALILFALILFALLRRPAH